ncbi:MAG: thermonuclease family protein [Oricola sp.]
MAKRQPRHSPSPSGGSPRRRRGDRGGLRAFVMVAAFAVIGAGAVLLYRQTGGIELVRLSGLVDPTVTSAYAPPAQPDFRATVAPRAMPLCGSGRRADCVVDGDTLWLEGEKIRIVNIDAPEVKGRCGAETARAADATRALARMVSNRPIRVQRQGEDRYGRTLAAVSTPDGDVGAALVRGRHAVIWRGRKEPAGTWCGG